jgi:L-fuconolactonase
VVHDEPDDDFMRGEAFQKGISKLKACGLAYDLLLFPRHLPVAADLVKTFPEQTFVLDHIAKPDIAGGILSPWREDLQTLAAFPNVACKLSGMVTEAGWHRWSAPDFHRCLDTVLEAFGPERVMIGSDWPVCMLSGDYSATLHIVTSYLRQFPADIQDAILGGNCVRIYRPPAREAFPSTHKQQRNGSSHEQRRKDEGGAPVRRQRHSDRIPAASGP